MTSPYGTKYGALIIATTIQEEDEEEFSDATAGGKVDPSPAPTRGAEFSGCVPMNSDDSSSNGSSSPVSHPADKDRRLSQLAASAVSSFASATSKLINRLLHVQHGTGRQGHSGQRCEGDGKVANAGGNAVPAAAPSAKHLLDRRTSPDGRSHRASGITSRFADRSTRGKLPCSDSRTSQHAEHHHGHLVRLMAGDDVRLALQALQLAAQIHDHVWGPAGTTATAGSREALLEAASPLYDTAMSAARAIQHRALHSLVKQAVRRYVNPARGSPDDVLRVILELLTGCGGTAAATAPAPSQQAPVRRAVSSCLSDVACGDRSVGGGSSCFAPHRMSEPESPSDYSLDSVASGYSPTSRHQRSSFGSNLSGRSSTRSSLDSCPSETSPPCLPRLSGLRA